jgi:transposase
MLAYLGIVWKKYKIFTRSCEIKHWLQCVNVMLITRLSFTKCTYSQWTWSRTCTKNTNPVLAHHTTPFQNSDPMSHSTARVDLKESWVTVSCCEWLNNTPNTNNCWLRDERLWWWRITWERIVWRPMIWCQLTSQQWSSHKTFYKEKELKIDPFKNWDLVHLQRDAH